mmetsp:Transcript_43394/g.68715  ORF Transcript_43394/g.68715 Transcript_43394/m.68715 type:complete len:241 (+) Transcript_43394:81-803(+)
MVLQPTNMFCCDCPLWFGAMLIMVCHFIACCWFLAVCFSNLVLHWPIGFGWSPSMEILITALNVAGLPILVAGFIGAMKRSQISVRIYLCYLFVCFVFDTVWLVSGVLFHDVCITYGVPGHVTAHYGHAFMCGFLQTVSYFFVAFMILAEVYCLFIIWSFCEQLHFDDSGPPLSDLIHGKEAVFKKIHGEREGPYAGIVGLAHSKLPTAYPAPCLGHGAYGTIESGAPTFSFFGGSEHHF